MLTTQVLLVRLKPGLHNVQVILIWLAQLGILKGDNAQVPVRLNMYPLWHLTQTVPDCSRQLGIVVGAGVKGTHWLFDKENPVIHD